MLRSIGSVMGMAFLLVACGGGGAAGDDNGTRAATVAPHDLEYALGTGEVGFAYGPFSPTVTGSVSGYSVDPALPEGLTFDTTSGVISGTPLAGSSGTHTVTASNAAGSTTTTLTMVVLVPPILTYTSPVTAAVGAELTPLVPTLSGNAEALSIYPALPEGLTFDPATGIVSGTPSRERVAVTYMISASNSGGAFTTADLILAVGPPPAGTALTGVFRGETVIGLGYVSGTHSGLTDSSGAFTYEEGQGISFSVGAVSIGAVSTANALITPVDLVAQGAGPSNHVLNVVRFLMMLDQDGNPNNGIQISAAVTAAAASWAPVDFDTADLPTTLSTLIQQASAADGVSHVLPDAAIAQAHLRTGFYCTRSGAYRGTFGWTDEAKDGRSSFTASVFPDGSMHSSAAYANDAMPGFVLQTNDAVSSSLDDTFAQSDDSGLSLQGSFADPTVLSGTYQASIGGSFEAVADAGVAATYKFFGSYTSTANDPADGGPYSASVLVGMDDSNEVSGLAFGAPSGGLTVFGLTGTVSGNTFTGTASYGYGGYGRPHTFHSPVSGSYVNTATGITFDGQFNTERTVVTFSTVGCRAN